MLKIGIFLISLIGYSCYFYNNYKFNINTKYISYCLSRYE